MSDLLRTPLFAFHHSVSAKMAPFSGWDMPIQYQSIIDERNWCRNKASLFDTSHMGILRFRGDIKHSNIEYACTQSLASIQVGRCSYGFLLNREGGIIDDLIVYRISDEELMIVVNASTSERVRLELDSCLQSGKLETLSPALAKIDLQGPSSRKIIEHSLNISVSNLRYFSFTKARYNTKDLIVSRTGYTGELGYELYLDASLIPKLWAELLQNDDVKPAGLGARDLLRLEMGYPLSGADIDESTTPLEAGLEAFVDFSKDFQGKKALLPMKSEGLPRVKVAFKTDSRRAPRHGYKIMSGQKEIGKVTSGIYSPETTCGIGMGYIDSLHKELNEFTLEMGRLTINAKISALPFYTNGTARMK